MMYKKFEKKIVLIEVYEYDLYNYNEHRTANTH